MANNIFNKIKEWLLEAQIPFKTLHHPPTPTSEDSAKARGEDLSIGGKAIVLKINKDFHLFVLSAARKLDSKAIKKQLKAKKLRFATAEELMDLTGLVTGAIPPLGSPIIPLKLFVDNSIVQNERIAFNAGSLTDSIIMQVEDYLQIAQPEVFDFSLPR